MRAIVLHHRETGKRHVIACVQQAEWFIAHRDPEDWAPVYVRKRRRWRQ